jgi:hypothetical protein
MLLSVMRYFTRAWCIGDLSEEESDAIIAAYRGHITAIAPLIPSGILELSQRWALHDARFKAVQFDHPTGSLYLRLRCGDLQYGYYDLLLHYTGATLIDHTLTGLPNLVRATGTEVLYDEIDVSGDGRFEHRMILWPKGEFAVSCAQFAFSIVSVASRDVP